MKAESKLAKVKSRGLIHTLITVAIKSEKTWDEMKDLLRLKLCNANIHMYTSGFMDIQQWENESLAAYVHWIRTEAKQYKFMNDSVTCYVWQC